MDDIFIYQPDENNQDLAQLNNQDFINDDNPNCGERLSAIFILIISLILIGMDFLSINI